MYKNIIIIIFLVSIILSFIKFLYNSIIKPVIILIFMLIFNAIILISILIFNTINFITNSVKNKMKVNKEEAFKRIIKLRVQIADYRCLFLKILISSIVSLLKYAVKSIKKYIKITTKAFIKLINVGGKSIVKYIKIIIKVYIKLINSKNPKELFYLSITICIVINLIMSPIIIFNPNYKFVTTTDKALVFFALIGMLIIVIIFLLSMNKLNNKKKNPGIFIDFLIAASLILCLVLSTLVMFEKVKNYGIQNKNELWLMMLISLYTVFILLLLIKVILDRGSIIISLTLGVFTYSITLIFLTCAIGFFITGRYPDNFEKDKYEIRSSSDMITYISSYSYRGAKYLLSFPSEEEFKVKLKVTDKPNKIHKFISEVINNILGRDLNSEVKIPFDIYIIYFVGLLFNIIILAFFVSYAASIVVLKNTSIDQYEEYIKNQNKIIDNYINYIKSKNKEIKMVLKENG